MKILAVADIHGKINRLESIERSINKYQVDILIVAGDIAGCRKTIFTVNRLAALSLPIFIVKGNADSALLSTEIAKVESIIDLHLNPTMIFDIPFIGLGGAIPIPFYAMLQLRESSLIKKAEKELKVESVLVTHTPPRGSTDKVMRRFHAGSSGLGKLVDSVQPRLVICGHIHEDCGVRYRGSTCVVNCSMGNGAKGVLIELKAGEEKINTHLLE